MIRLSPAKVRLMIGMIPVSMSQMPSKRTPRCLGARTALVLRLNMIDSLALKVFPQNRRPAYFSLVTLRPTALCLNPREAGQRGFTTLDRISHRPATPPS